MSNAELQNVRLSVPTNYVNHHGVIKDDHEISGSCQDLFFPILINGTGAHFPGARGWADFRFGDDAGTAYVWFLQALLAGTDCQNYGTRFIKVDPKVKPGLYRSILILSARELIGTPPLSTQERKRLKKNSVKIGIYSKTQLADIDSMMIELKKPKKGKEKEGEDASGGVAHACREYMNYLNDPVMNWGVFEEDYEPLVIDLGDHQDMDEDDEEADEDDDMADGYSVDICKKLGFYVTALPREEHAVEDGHDFIEGYMVRLVVLDKSWSFGDVITEIIQNSSDRCKHVTERGAQRPFFGEKFAKLSKFFDSRHPVGNTTTWETYYRYAKLVMPDLERPDYFYLSNYTRQESVYSVFSLRNALQYVSANAKVDRHYLQMDSWIVDRVARFPRGSKTWQYPDQMLRWFDPQWIAFCDHMFPNIDNDQDFLESLKSTNDIERLVDTHENGDRVGINYNDLEQLVDSMAVLMRDSYNVSKSSLSLHGLLGYPTTNQWLHYAAEAEVFKKQLGTMFRQSFFDLIDKVRPYIEQYGCPEWRNRLPMYLEEEVTQYDAYSRALKLTQDKCGGRHRSLWLTEGDVSELGISEPNKIVLKYYIDERRKGKFATLTRPYQIYDKEFGFFGNAILHELLLYTRVGKVVHPLICLRSDGLFSAYEYHPRELTYNVMLHGIHDCGKSYAGIKIFVEMRTIPGTVNEVSSTSEQAHTAQHHHDEMWAMDEAPQYLVDAKEAEKYPDRVNQEKIKMTAKQITREVFSTIVLPNGDSQRWTKKLVVDFYVARLEITNSWIQEGALASRFDTMLVNNVDVPVNEMNARQIGADLKNGTRTFFRVDQYLNMATNKAMFTFAVLEVNLDLFEHISNATLACLKADGVVSATMGGRPLEIMRPLVRQLVIKMANRHVRDMYNSPHYRKEFHVDQLRDSQPYMYVTLEIIWYVWTMCGHQFVDPVYANFLRAAIKLSKSNYDPTLSNYENYCRDMDNKITWSKMQPRNSNTQSRHNPHAVVDWQLDLNYIVLMGSSIEDICNRMSAQTEPRIGRVQLLGAANAMREKFVFIESPLAPQNQRDLEVCHRYLTPPNPDTGYPGQRPFGMQCPNPFLNGRAAFMIEQDATLTEADMPRDPGASMPIVKFENNGKHMLIMPNAVGLYQNQQIINALTHASICAGFSPGKYLLGIQSANSHTRLEYRRFTQEMIDYIVAERDADEGWEYVNGKLEWTGSSDTPEMVRPFPRSKGLRFNLRGALSEVEGVMISSASLEPVGPEGPEEQVYYQDSVDAMQSGSVIMRSPDDWSATRRHIECGRPLDEPVRTQSYLRQQYELEARKRGKPVHLGVNYPTDMARDEVIKNKMWDRAGTRRGGSVMGKYAAMIASGELPPKRARTGHSTVPIVHSARQISIAPPEEEDEFDMNELL